MLPTVSAANGNLYVSFTLRRQTGNKDPFAFVSAEAILPSGNKYIVNQEVFLNESMTGKAIYASIQNASKSSFALNTIFDLKIIAANGFSYKAFYSVGKSNQITFQYIEINSCSSEETRLLSDLKNDADISKKNRLFGGDSG